MKNKAALRMSKHNRRRLVTGVSPSAFTLLELMVVVILVGVISAIAIPSFQKYLHEAKASEGTRMLLEVAKQQRAIYETTRVKVDGAPKPLKTFTEYLAFHTEAPSGLRPLDYRVAGKPKFNLIIGQSAPIPELKGLGPSSFNELSEYSHLPEPVNTFGVFGNDLDEYFIGVEGNLDGDEWLQVMAVDKNGTLYMICNDYGDEAKMVQSIDDSAPPLRCQAEAEAPAPTGSGGGTGW